MGKHQVNTKKISIDTDAFSSGQISSKIWLCEKLEETISSEPLNIWIYGGWYGVSAFLLLSRKNFPIKSIRCFDVDESCMSIADTLLENWVWQEWTFKSFTEDCNDLDPVSGYQGHVPDLIINTSTEHFKDMDWWNKIPTRMKVAIQGNNMPHWDHHQHHADLASFCEQYKLDRTLYSGKLDFKYPDWTFSRYMLIGEK